MVLHAENVINYFSPISIPVGKGLFDRRMVFNFETQGGYPIFVLKINPAYHEISLDTQADFTVVQGECNYNVTTDGEVGVNELYTLSLDATRHLRDFVSAQNNNAIQAQSIPDPLLEQILKSLVAIVEKLKGDQ